MELGNLTEMWYDIKNIRHNKFEFVEEVIMYIENKYWQNYIGDTDDSLNLIAFLEDQGSNEIAFSEIRIIALFPLKSAIKKLYKAKSGMLDGGTIKMRPLPFLFEK